MTTNEFGGEVPAGLGGEQPGAREYVAIIEGEGERWGAYVPDLPGLGVAAKSEQEAMRLIREAIDFHLEGMRAEGLPVPPPSARVHRTGSTSPS